MITRMPTPGRGTKVVLGFSPHSHRRHQKHELKLMTTFFA